MRKGLRDNYSPHLELLPCSNSPSHRCQRFQGGFHFFGHFVGKESRGEHHAAGSKRLRTSFAGRMARSDRSASRRTLVEHWFDGVNHDPPGGGDCNRRRDHDRG
jgi:hypothetical protein